MNWLGHKREIVQLGNPLLRKNAALVEDILADDVQQVIANLLTTLAQTKGVGIAAPQIGESLRIVVVASRPTPRYPKAPSIDPVVMINPEFQISNQRQVKDWEGCLSIPGIRALVPRYMQLRVSYLDTAGQSCEMDLENFVARIFQHEYDHLQGLVYLDRVEDNREIIAESEYLKMFS